MEHIEVTIIGAGIVGLAIAAESSKKRQTLVIEKHEGFGRETSSRNSEIIHSGIYYSKNSLKAKLCLEGNNLIYEICRKNNIPCKNTGKLIIASKDDEISKLEELLKKGTDNGLQNLEILPEHKVRKLEPNINARVALFSPTSGIVDSHKLMEFFESQINSNENGILLYNQEVIDIKKLDDKYKLKIKNRNHDYYSFTTSIVVNSSGLFADKIASIAGFDIERYKYKLYFCKGEYFIVRNGVGKVRSLVYPLPEKKLTGLGIHTSVDLSGELRLGPNAFYVNDLNYDVDESHKDQFFNAGRQYLNFLSREDLAPGFAGIRPKLQGPNDEYKDFVISHEADKGFPGFINLIGIESPGLTCSPAIARYVSKMVDEILS